MIMLYSGNSIDFENNIPYYIQLIDIIKTKISSGEWQVEDRIPSEPELCDAYGVSRTVVRQALREIELEGLIIRRKGKGTYVARPKIGESLAQKLTGFYQDMDERGHKVFTQVLRQQIIPASEKIASYLEIEPDTPVIDVHRLRFIDNEPIVLVTSYLPHNLCPQLVNADLSHQSLYAFIEANCGVTIASGKRYIEAVAANDSEAKLLQMDIGSPLILLDSVSYLEDGQPIEYYHAVHRGDRSRFEVELVRVRESGKLKDTLEEVAKELPSSN
jgi:GntR family transcriptional regulator